MLVPHCPSKFPISGNGMLKKEITPLRYKIYTVLKVFLRTRLRVIWILYTQSSLLLPGLCICCLSWNTPALLFFTYPLPFLSSRFKPMFTTIPSDIIQQTVQSEAHGPIKDRGNYLNSSHHSVKLFHALVHLFIFYLYFYI